jgi:phage terminase Nu1 subunit (DNA packaging protein)
MGEIVNRNQLAEIFGVSRTTIGAWIREGLPAVGGGKGGVAFKIDSEAAIRWYIERDIERETAGLHSLRVPSSIRYHRSGT